MKHSIGLFGIISIVLLVFLIAIGVNGIYQDVTWSYQYDKQIGDYFELSDRSSDASVKLQYFNKFVDALERNDLTNGQTSVFWQRPISELSYNYQVAKSLQSRLENISQMNPKSFEYQTAMQQITLQEYCWFPTNIFEQGYLLQHGVWGSALFPVDVENRCVSSSSK